MRYVRPSLLLSALVVFMLGCGSTSNQTSSTSGPPPGTTPSPTPSATPSPTPGAPTPTPSGGEVHLRAHGEASISGAKAELNGTFERLSGQTHLDGNLENINMPVGSAISFCLVQAGRVVPLAVGAIREHNQSREAEFHIRTENGQTPPNVQAGDVLQSRDGANGNAPDCSRPLLVAGTFVPDTSSGH